MRQSLLPADVATMCHIRATRLGGAPAPEFRAYVWRGGAADRPEIREEPLVEGRGGEVVNAEGSEDQP